MAERNWGYLEWIREQPCCLCRLRDVEAHHPRVGFVEDGKVVEGTNPGGAQRASDRWAVPLCNKHHRELHSMGEGEFWASYHVDPFALALRYQIKVRR
jgi:hypothetical protein